MIFIDASALVAILADEPERDRFLEVIDRNESLTSPMALFECALGLSRITGCSLADAGRLVREFVASANIREIAIQPADLPVALDAAARFGKGRGHPARLNLGDCFAYASAKNAGARLLYKGDDFDRTDIAAAVD